MPRCRHRAVKLQRMQVLTISPQSAVPHSACAVPAQAEQRVGHILPHGRTIPPGVTTFPHERDKTQPVGWKGRKAQRQNSWASPRLPVVVQPNSPASATQEDPWKHEKLNLSKKHWTQLILLSKELPQIGSESSKFLFGRKTDRRVWSQWTGRHKRAKLKPRITPPHPSNLAGVARCPLGLHPTQGATTEAGKPTAG